MVLDGQLWVPPALHAAGSLPRMAHELIRAIAALPHCRPAVLVTVTRSFGRLVTSVVAVDAVVDRAAVAVESAASVISEHSISSSIVGPWAG